MDPIVLENFDVLLGASFKQQGFFKFFVYHDILLYDNIYYLVAQCLIIMHCIVNFNLIIYLWYVI